MSIKSQEQKIDNAGIDEQLAAYNHAHNALQAQGFMTAWENTVIQKAGAVAAAMARKAIQDGQKGLTRYEVMALLDAAQTFGMILLGSVDEAADKATGNRGFYRRNVGPVIQNIQRFEQREVGHDPNCPDCRAAVAGTETIQ